MKAKYDAVIIGAGPIGMYTSIKLAQGGYRPLVIEEDAQIGKPRFCTGLISREAFDEFGLPREAIENEFSSASIISPLGSRVCLKSKYEVYVTDRTIFDQGLYQKAKKKGVEFLLNCRCSGLKNHQDYIEAKIALDGTETTLRGKVAVLSTGIKYNLHRAAGFLPPVSFLDCSQTQLIAEAQDGIEIFLGNSIAPHSFAWKVPINKKKIRVGISTYRNSPAFLKSFLKHLKLKGGIKRGDLNIVRRPIPLEPIRHTYAARILVVGDAAGQVKPTTGGGIYFGLLCADLASQAVIDAFKRGDFSEKFLRRYEINWKKKIEFDMTMSIYFRKLIARFNDEQIEELVKFCSQTETQRLIEKYADFNHHGKFIQELIKRPAFWKHLYRIVSTR